MIPGSASPLLLESGAGGGENPYQIKRSLRFRASNTAYLDRTPSVAGNRRTWTWSGWVKRGELARHTLFHAATGPTDQFVIEFEAASTMAITDFRSGGTILSYKVTTAMYRDPSAWYHVMVATNTTLATAEDRFKVYVNGIRITSFSTNTLNTAQNADLTVNSTGFHRIGLSQYETFYLDGYLSEVNFIDGQALTPVSFGMIDPVTGQWSPIAYAGTYGTNGFYLDFSDPSSTTNLCLDRSGNANNWTPSGISITAGATYDSMVDVPTRYADGGNGRGNYATLNPIDTTADNTGTLTNANLTLTSDGPTSGTGILRTSTIRVTSGLWYMEVTLESMGSAWYQYIGTQGEDGGGITLGIAAAVNSGIIVATGFSNQTGLGFAVGGDVIGMALNKNTNTATFYKNGVQLGVAATTTYVGSVCFLSSAFYSDGVRVTHTNFGQRPFTYTPPTGFKALHTGNLLAPAITKPRAYFDATLYTGDGITQGVVNSGAMQPDLVWIKSRSAATDHKLTDSVRGVTKALSSNLTAAETTNANGLTAFNSNGFTINPDTNYNNNLATYVAWQWKKGATPGFDIVTYTGNGANRTVAHALGVAPKVVLVKGIGAATDWQMYHVALANTQKMVLNTTAAAVTDATAWNSTSPTSAVFSLGTQAAVNTNLATYVAYCFSEIEGYSKFGGYTGNGSTDGPFMYCGFRPRFVMVKRTDVIAISSWLVIDTLREPFNVASLYLLPDSAGAEASALGAVLDITSTGFKLRNSASGYNVSGATVIFMAFAEAPFKYALAR